MKGDFTRGHRPDQKRGEKYRKVLLQEGRLVLDSDIAAGVDAVDTSLRDLASDVGCKTGSPNLGYVVTPGPLLALFETLDGVTMPAPGGTFSAYRDYAVKYLERYPSIYVGGQASSGSVTVLCRRKLTRAAYGTVRIWARAGVTVDLLIDGQPTSFTGIDATQLLPYDVTVPVALTEYQTISFGFNAAGPSNEAWVAMIEGYEEAEERPLFWHTAGRYYLHGLAVESADDGQYPDATYPAAKGFSATDQVSTPGVYFVAYLEGWERLITRIEDPGIQEQALGGILDTTVRSKAIGQVKIARFEGDVFDPGTQADKVPSAFEAVNRGGAQLDVTTTPTVDNLDPCAIPEAGGYIGADNRCYRFEVHTGGDPGDVLVKWSRNNGSDVFAVTSIPADLAHLVLATGAEVRDGDLIELIDETDDLGDQDLAEVDFSPLEVTPANRAVGQLFYAETTQTAGQVKLRMTDAAKTPTTVPVDFGPTVKIPKVRVWHGLLDTTPLVLGDPPVTEFDLGDGVQVELSGTDFRPGDYWQYEARKLTDNANGTWQKEPHGPERVFAPLALFRYGGDAQPLELVRWYDHQYSALCELNADDIAYDGGKVGTKADTVQEAIDELYEKTDGGCCDIVLTPEEAGDDTARIQEAIDALPDGGELCLRRGEYRTSATLVIDGKRVTISGCPHAVVIGDDDDGEAMFEVKNGGQLTLRDLLVFARPDTGPVVWISGPFYSGEEIILGPVQTLKVILERTTAVHTGDQGLIVRVGLPTVPALDPMSAAAMPWDWSSYDTALVEARESLLAARVAIAAQPLNLVLSESVVMFETIGVYAVTMVTQRIEGSSFHASFLLETRETLQALADDELTAQVPQLLENNFWFPASGSVGLAVTSFQTGSLEGSLFVCATALFMGSSSSLDSHDNEYWCGDSPAVRLDYCSAARFNHDAFQSSVVGLHVPFVADGLEVANCSFGGSRGAVFCATPVGSSLSAGPIYAYFHNVQIRENTFPTWTHGVQFGPYFEDIVPDPLFVEMTSIDISANDFSRGYSQIAIACSLFDDPVFSAIPTGNPRLRIARNQMNCPVGILTFGSDVIVEDNIIHGDQTLYGTGWLYGLELTGVQRIGVLMGDAQRSVVRNNLIELEVVEFSGDGPPPSVGVVLLQRYSDSPCTDIVVQDNFITAVAPFVSLAMFEGVGADGARLLRVLGNRLSGRAVMFEAVSDSTVRGNEVRGQATMKDSARCVVSDNRFFFQGTSGGLRIERAKETWQLENNRSDGTILLQPDTFYSPAAGQVEYEFHPQVIGNWAALDLVIGHPQTVVVTPSATYSNAQPNAESRVQIVANRAGDWIVTDYYSKVVFANNFAKNYSPGWATTSVILSPNYDAP